MTAAAISCTGVFVSILSRFDDKVRRFAISHFVGFFPEEMGLQSSGEAYFRYTVRQNPNGVGGGFLNYFAASFHCGSLQQRART